MREDLTMMADGLHAILHIMVLSWLSLLYVHDLIITLLSVRWLDLILIVVLYMMFYSVRSIHSFHCQIPV